eukprot:GHVR01112970.1.p1 GENE.GHVR01112970.1~~GHVR01112970.1.p1  ORF type:complete len:566 (-),score=110.15 GHVR01112970.1:1287-2984(-)
MAKGLIEIALQLGKQLGANTSKFLGTKSNVTFMGPGPKDGMLFQKSINPESFASLGIEKVLPDIESSLGYAVGGKLNDIQLNKLIDNMSIMADVLDPLAAKNIVDASSRFGGGLESLKGLGLKNLDNVRSKSGMAERQLTDAASERPINYSGQLTSMADEPGQSGLSYAIKNPAKIPGDESAAFPSFNTAENIDTSSPLMSKLENRVGGMRDETEAATGIMANVAKGDLPGKTGAAREFLVNSLKVGDDYPSTTLTDVMSAQDMKFIMEGGGGAMGDPLVLVQKYFGPRIAEMIPNGGTTEEIAIFTKKVLENVEDAKGLRPDEPAFDPLTARFVDELADGGIAGLETRQGLKFGGKTGKSILSKIDDKMIKKAADDIFPTDDYKYDAELVVDALVENNPKLFKNLLAGDLDDALRSELYGLAVSETGTRAAMKIKAGKMERPLFDENGNLNKDAVLADATKYGGLDGKQASGFIKKGDEITSENFGNSQFAPRPSFQLNVEKAVSDLNIPREEAIRIAQLPSDQQMLALQKYMDMNTAQRAELMNYNPKTFDAAKGGLAKILEL